MTVVTEDIDLPGIVENFTTPVTVTVSLVGANGRETHAFHTPSSTTLVSNNRFRLDAVSTVWSLDLLPNSELLPAGTVYRRTIAVGTRFTANDFFEVPDVGGPFTVEDLLTDPPAALASSALAAHAADTTLHGGTELLFAERAAMAHVSVASATAVPIPGVEGIITVPDRPYIVRYEAIGRIDDANASGAVVIAINGNMDILGSGATSVRTATIAEEFVTWEGTFRVPNAYHAPTPGDQVEYDLRVRRLSGTGNVVVRTTDDGGFGRNSASLQVVTC
jgi:hypothetical protein